MYFLCVVKTISFLSDLENYVFECAGREESLCRSHVYVCAKKAVLREQVRQDVQPFGTV